MIETPQQRPPALIFVIIYTFVLGSFEIVSIWVKLVIRHQEGLTILVSAAMALLYFLCGRGLWTRNSRALVWTTRFYWACVLFRVAFFPFKILNTPNIVSIGFDVGFLALDLAVLACLYRPDVKAYLTVASTVPEAAPPRIDDSSSA